MNQHGSCLATDGFVDLCWFILLCRHGASNSLARPLSQVLIMCSIYLQGQKVYKAQRCGAMASNHLGICSRLSTSSGIRTGMRMTCGTVTNFVAPRFAHTTQARQMSSLLLPALL